MFTTATTRTVTKPLVSYDINLPYIEQCSNNISTKYPKYLPTWDPVWYGPLPLFHFEDPVIPVKDIPAAKSTRPLPKPPVTKATLSELDIPQIMYKPRLRHDINFDPDLHFRPNLDGERGRRKGQKANALWNQVEAFLREFMANPTVFENGFADDEWSLPIIIQTIGEILGTLIPPEDRSAVQDVLNVNLLMKNFRGGVSDLEKLGLYLSRALKSHCAPMRDESVDDMVNQLTVGNRNRDVSLLVQGLKSLLSVLEAMKLDVANHQVRCLRPLLIEDTVEFEQASFTKKIALKKVQTSKSYPGNKPPQIPPSQRDISALVKAIADPNDQHKSIGNIDQERLEQEFYTAITNLSKIFSSSVTNIARYVTSPKRILTGLKPSLLFPVCLLFMKPVAGLPTRSLPEKDGDEMSDGFKLFWQTKVRQFTDETAGPLLYNICISLVLTAVYIVIIQLHNGRWKGQSLLLAATIATSTGFFFLSMGERLPGWQVVIAWIFAAGFLMTYIKEKLADLQLSGIHAVSIVAPGMVGAVAIARYAEIEGKWPDRWFLASVVVLPCIMVSTCLWTAFLHETNVIHRVDNGTYLRPALDMMREVYTAVMNWHGVYQPATPEIPTNLEPQVSTTSEDTVTSIANRTSGGVEASPAMYNSVQPVEARNQQPLNTPRRGKQRKWRSQRRSSRIYFFP